MTKRNRQDRAHEEMLSAQLLLEHGHEEAAVSRACYAAFYPAKATLDQLGQQRNTHGSVISAFGRFVVKEGGADRAAGRALNELFDNRADADYVMTSISADDARDALDRAEIVVDVVDAWLAERK